jgi:hypothetical protein
LFLFSLGSPLLTRASYCWNGTKKIVRRNKEKGSSDRDERQHETASQKPHD